MKKHKDPVQRRPRSWSAAKTEAVLWADTASLMCGAADGEAADLWTRPTATPQSLICTLIPADKRADSRRAKAAKINLSAFLIGRQHMKV